MELVENGWKAGEVEGYKQRSRKLFPVFSLLMDVQTGVYDLSRYITPPPEPVMKHRLQWHGPPSPWEASNGDRPVVAASNPCRCCSIGRSVIKTIRTLLSMHYRSRGTVNVPMTQWAEAEEKSLQMWLARGLQEVNADRLSVSLTTLLFTAQTGSRSPTRPG